MSRSYFISDVHLGAAFCDRKALEQRFVALLDRIREEKADIGGGYYMDDYIMEAPVEG